MRLLAVVLALVALFCAGPVFVLHADLWRAPNWVRLVLLLSALQLVYTLWMVSLPDWSTVWVAMLVFALSAALYGMALAIVMFTPLDTPLALGLSDVRDQAPAWCAAVVALTTLVTYACGRTASRWRLAENSCVK